MNAAAARNIDESRPARLPARRAGAARPVRLPAPPPATTSTVWLARLAHRGMPLQERRAVEHSLVLVNSDRYPHGTPVDFAGQDTRGRLPAGWLADVRYRACDGTVLRAEVSDAVARPAAPLWFAEIAHVTSGVPAVSLLAFAGTAYPTGTLVGPHDVARRGLRMADRIGEVRWWTRSGVVDAVTVEPTFRRQGIGRLLVTVAEGVRAVRGWAPLTCDGRVTDAGARWLEGAPAYWRPRLAEETTLLPEDDEPEGPTGVARLLR
jgi:GNAT superfamily N-acetyltransferase